MVQDGISVDEDPARRNTKLRPATPSIDLLNNQTMFTIAGHAMASCRFFDLAVDQSLHKLA